MRAARKIVAASRTTPRFQAQLRLQCGGQSRIGPGKIALLEAIAATGSISAAGRRLEMSYRRAWLLVDDLNHLFAEPVVQAATGGAHGGGAKLTAFGAELVAAYRALEAETQAAVDRAFAPFVPRTGHGDQRG